MRTLKTDTKVKVDNKEVGKDEKRSTPSRRKKIHISRRSRRRQKRRRTYFRRSPRCAKTTTSSPRCSAAPSCGCNRRRRRPKRSSPICRRKWLPRFHCHDRTFALDGLRAARAGAGRRWLPDPVSAVPGRRDQFPAGQDAQCAASVRVAVRARQLPHDAGERRDVAQRLGDRCVPDRYHRSRVSDRPRYRVAAQSCRSRAGAGCAA